MSLSFIQASRIVSEAKDLKQKKFVLASSTQLEQLELFIKAHSIQNGFIADFTTLPFNTLNQYLLEPESTKHHVFILFPWDLCPSLDWRLGVSRKELNIHQFIDEAEVLLSKIKKLSNNKIIYCNFEIPPIFLDRATNQLLSLELKLTALRNGAEIMPSSAFSLPSYLAYGFPFQSRELASIASVISKQIKQSTPSKKVLITDFDNVLWKGVIGEDGVDGIKYSPEGVGYPHYIYQTYIKKLKSAGVLVAGVSRNDEDLANLPFESCDMEFKRTDFVAFVASYHAKSSQISALSKQLNLPLDSFIFVDDNPLEIEEVSTQCPEVECILFPSGSSDFLSFLNKLSAFFNIQEITSEDINRTDMYKTRTAAAIPSAAEGADLTDYLSSLNMEISVNYCNPKNSTRAIQLINKTNQFNSNGIRIKHDEVNSKIGSELELISFSLSDKHGNHGEIAAVLFDSSGILQHFVISCRVFQRKVEHYILLWLYENKLLSILELSYIKTNKNLPFEMFIDKLPLLESITSQRRIDLTSFNEIHHGLKKIFKINDSKML